MSFFRPILLLFSGCLLACQQEASLEQAKASCGELVHSYAFLRDRLDGNGVAELFMEDGKFSIFGENFEGREIIRERVLAAKAGPITRHLVSTVDIQLDGQDKARGVSYVTIYIGPKSNSTNPIEVEGFAGIGEYHDRFVLDKTGCKIESREFIPVFTYLDD